MQPKQLSLSLCIRRIAAKEMTLFFASPVAYLFLATFSALTLFIFFWGESFFARNIADVRPLFTWMPLLLIFLTSTLTMRLWSEEKRTGTLEHLLTQPVPIWCVVVGKFLGCLCLLALALMITLPLPISVSFIGELDWGPVIAGYLATFFLGAAYLSIGLFVSARSPNQIISLITASLVCGLLYLMGTQTMTHFLGNTLGEWLRLLSTSARFEAITRGMIDARDFYYFLSLILVFLTLNTFILEHARWALNRTSKHHKLWYTLTSLVLLNSIFANIWLAPVTHARFDTTQEKLYSISPATYNYLAQLQEPLLLRAYFSEKTHPLLAPLVPQLRDLLDEYAVAGRGQVRVELIDPAKSSTLEREANEKYGIRPTPFQVADRYQSSIVSSYFNILVQYGDAFEILSFNDLIEVHAQSETNIDVKLRNPEYELTLAVKNVLQNYQSTGNLFDTLPETLTFNAYISADKHLPESLITYRKTVESTLKDMQTTAKGRLQFNIIDPSLDPQTALMLQNQYGLMPMVMDVFNEDGFYFYLTLTNGTQVIQLPLDDLSTGTLERNLNAGIKRFSSGFTKTVALVLPQVQPNYAQYGLGSAQFSGLENFLGSTFNIQPESLDSGRVASTADILLLLAPEELSETQLFAVDQFLMQGGTVIAATSPYSADFSNQSLNLQPYESGLSAWLSHHGLTVENTLVLDPQNTALPIPMTRDVGGFQMQELRMLEYPYFIDVRRQGLNTDNPITSHVPQLTFTWASPIRIDTEKSQDKAITRLVESSNGAWLSSNTDVMPQVDANGLSTFTQEGTSQTHLLGVMSEGRFTSYFQGKEATFLNETAPENRFLSQQMLERSPESARIILFSSNDFLRDEILQFASSAYNAEYLNTQELIANSIDWSLEDKGLLSIRSRSNFNRTLPPMEHSTQVFWESINYALAGLALCVIMLVQRQHRKIKERAYLNLLTD